MVDYAYLMRMPNDTVRVEHDRHLEGLFTREDWLRFLTGAGFHARCVRFEHSELEPGTHEVFVATKPVSSPRVSRSEQEQEQQQQ